MVTPSRREILPDEQPHLDALGAELRALRLAARATPSEVALRAVVGRGRVVHAGRVTQEILGARAQLTAGQVGAIERGQRRTRRSTLQRLVRALVDEDLVDETVEYLVEVAGSALAPEALEAHLARIEARRQRRANYYRARQRQMLQQSILDLRKIGMEGEVGARVKALLARLEGDAARMEAEDGAERPEPRPPVPTPSRPRPDVVRRTILEELRESLRARDERARTEDSRP